MIIWEAQLRAVMAAWVGDFCRQQRVASREQGDGNLRWTFLADRNFNCLARATMGRWNGGQGVGAFRQPWGGRKAADRRLASGRQAPGASSQVAVAWGQEASVAARRRQWPPRPQAQPLAAADARKWRWRWRLEALQLPYRHRGRQGAAQETAAATMPAARKPRGVSKNGAGDRSADGDGGCGRTMAVAARAAHKQRAAGAAAFTAAAAVTVSWWPRRRCQGGIGACCC